MPPQMPVNEADRLAALALYQVLDTPPEFAHDALTELAAQICDCPVALISLIDERRQWFKSKYGLPADFAECPREMTVCTTTICSNDLLYVPDLTADPRFKDLPIVTGEPYIRFYCGMPLITGMVTPWARCAWSTSRRTSSTRRSAKPCAASRSRRWRSWSCDASCWSGMRC